MRELNLRPDGRQIEVLQDGVSREALRQIIRNRLRLCDVAGQRVGQRRTGFDVFAARSPQGCGGLGFRLGSVAKKRFAERLGGSIARGSFRLVGMLGGCDRAVGQVAGVLQQAGRGRRRRVNKLKLASKRNGRKSIAA